jgi:hypothetical protein
MPDWMDSELHAPALALTRAAQAGDQPAAARINKSFQPLWNLFRKSGRFRVMYVMADALGFAEIEPEPPRPILSLPREIYGRVEEALQILMSEIALPLKWFLRSPRCGSRSRLLAHLGRSALICS